MGKFTRKPDMALSFILFTENFRTDGAWGQLIWDIYIHEVWQTSLGSPRARTLHFEVWHWSVGFYHCVHSHGAELTQPLCTGGDSWWWLFLSPSLLDNLLSPQCWWETSVTWVCYLAALRKETQVKALSYELGWVDRGSIGHGYFLGTFIRCWVMGWVQVRRDRVS